MLINAAKNNTYSGESIKIENRCLLVIIFFFITAKDIMLLYIIGIKYFNLFNSSGNFPIRILIIINNMSTIGIILVITANLLESIYVVKVTAPAILSL